MRVACQHIAHLVFFIIELETIVRFALELDDVAAEFGQDVLRRAGLVSALPRAKLRRLWLCAGLRCSWLWPIQHRFA